MANNPNTSSQGATIYNHKDPLVSKEIASLKADIVKLKKRIEVLEKELGI